MNLLRAYVFLIILVKFVYLFFVLRSLYLHNKFKNNPNDKNYKLLLETNDHLKNQLELVFISLVAILLIILFNPINKNLILDNETRTILYLFGFLLLITADWLSFFKY
jgi:hypothetical protein